MLIKHLKKKKFMKFSDKIFILPIIILTTNFIFRILDFSKILTSFPLDTTNDLTAYIADISFFSQYGFFGHVPLWYNGFTLFNIYPPGWVLFTYPWYLISGNVLISSFISCMLLFFLGFIGTWLIGKELKVSRIKRIALFLFIYANPMMIGAILKQGRIPSLMALTLLVYLFYLCLYFKERELNWKAIFLPIVYAGLILTHQTETVLGAAFLLGLFLVKKKKEKIQLVILMCLSILFSSFWLFHFLQATIETGFLKFNFGNWLLDWHSYFWNNLAGVFISHALFITFFIVYQQKKEKKLLLFYSPTLVYNFLYLTRLALFIPIIKNIYPDPWQDFLMLNLCIIFITLGYASFTKKRKVMLAIGLIIISIAGVGYNIIKTPTMESWNTEDKEAIALIPLLDTNSHFLMFNENSTHLYSRAIYSYAAIYYNVSSASGWFEVNKEYSYIESLNTLYKDFYTNTSHCKDLDTFHTDFNMTQVLANGKYCDAIETCGWTIKAVNGSSCILSLPLAVQQ
ncbi:hypothetical protein EXS74_02480 [Candidatus Woesearchaeota archaeon]|nr:hypothetical protein [Candidatus Woesearchaeota archaeon]